MLFIFTLLEPNPATREMAADVVLALMRAGISHKAAAIDMGVGESVLSEQLAGKKHLSLWRLTRLPATFWTAFDAIRADRRGDLLVRSDLLDLIRGAAALERRMVKADTEPAAAKARQA